MRVLVLLVYRWTIPVDTLHRGYFFQCPTFGTANIWGNSLAFDPFMHCIASLSL